MSQQQQQPIQPQQNSIQPQQYSTQPQQYSTQNNQQQVGPPKNISNDDLLMYIVCFFCPPLAIFWLKNGCQQETLITLVLWFLFWFPGFIYALFLIMQHQKEVQEKNAQGGMV